MARTAKVAEKKERPTLLIEGRMINGSLFEKDQFDEKSTASYKIEIAFEKTHKQVDAVCDAILAYADEVWPKEKLELNIDGGTLVSGILDGDKLATKREQKGKQGDAYKGMFVIRANTIYNLHGQDAPGGIQVWDEDVQPIGPANQQEIYPGCYVQAAVTIADYEDDRSGNHAITFYLTAVQKTGDGEKLVASKDTSTLFQARGRSTAGAAPATGGRRSRAG